MNALTFITCGSVDDGKSTLIGRLLVDSKAVLQDHLAGVQRQGTTDLALLTDGLSAEREQGITIDVAYRYFSTEARKFIIGDAPGHEQYTRNMVTAASSADAAVVLVDALKLPWAHAAGAAQPSAQDGHGLLPQTRRHSLLVQLLRVPSVVFAINKLDAVPDAQVAFEKIRAALQAFATDAGLNVNAIVPVSALVGHNVVDAADDGWCGYHGPTLLQVLEGLPNTRHNDATPPAFSVQWVEKFHDSGVTTQGRRVFWGKLAEGSLQVGDEVQVFPSGPKAVVARTLSGTRVAQPLAAGHNGGVVLDREVDISRGDWVLASPYPGVKSTLATVSWLDDEPLRPGRVYWALHGHRWVKAKVTRIVHRLNIHTLAHEDASELPPNALGQIELMFQEALPVQPYSASRVMGALILVDTASHKTSGAVMIN